MWDATFKALNDPTRRQILRILRERDCNASEIAAAFSISKPSISHHLDLLKRAQLVTARREGQYIIYSLNTTVLDEVITWFLELRGSDAENPMS
jgi:ArsR family transcriptional regulator, arsenate/arsenite/antimonite-responsive transcriptional repressor